MASTVMLVEVADRDDFQRSLGRTLYRVRRRLTKYRSQDSIAEALGVDGDTIGRWERGEQEPRAFELAMLCDRYEVPADWLLNPTDSGRELETRIEILRRDRLVRAALEAAADDEADDPSPASDADGGAPPDRPQA